MIILGLDPGLARTGYGLIEIRRNKPRLLKYGCISTKSSELHAHRLKTIFNEVKRIISQFNPDVVVLEELFFSKNVKTALKVGEARGVATLAIGTKGVEIKEFTPLQVKLSIVGRGHASKPQVQYMVKRLLPELEEIPKPDDAADALAIALCFYHSLSGIRVK